MGNGNSWPGQMGGPGKGVEMRNEGELPGGPLVGGAWERRRTGDRGGGRRSEKTRGEEDREDRRQEKGEDVHGAACVWAQRGRMRAVRGRDGAMEEQDGH